MNTKVVRLFIQETSIVQLIGLFKIINIIIRHLGAAWIEKCLPDVLISESTYATTYRDSKRVRETEFLL